MATSPKSFQGKMIETKEYSHVVTINIWIPPSCLKIHQKNLAVKQMANSHFLFVSLTILRVKWKKKKHNREVSHFFNGMGVLMDFETWG